MSDLFIYSSCSFCLYKDNFASILKKNKYIIFTLPHMNPITKYSLNSYQGVLCNIRVEALLKNCLFIIYVFIMLY